MKRRELLVTSSAGAMLGVSGCTDESGSPDTGTTDDSEVGDDSSRPSDPPLPGRDEFPARPDELDEWSVLDYVEEHQRTVKVQPRFHGGCDPETAVEYDEGFYVGMQRCVVDTPDGDVDELPVLYFVTDSETYRIELDELQGPDAGGGPHNLLLVNFDDTAHNLSVELSHHDTDEEPVTALDETYALADQSGIHLDDVPVSYQETELHAELEDGPEVDERLEVAPFGGFDPFRAIYITPEGDLVLREIEFNF